MALTVDTLRNLTGTGSITLDRQNDGLVAGKHQSFRSFFNIGDARQQNVETLVAIHHAIANDPRFAAPDVRAEAARLLGQIRTDRAIGAAQVRTIMQTLDRLTLNTQDAVNARVAARLAATMPSWAAGHEADLLRLVQSHVLSGRTAGESFLELDVAGRMDAIMGKVGVAVEHIGDDPRLKELFFATMDRTLHLYDGSLASDQKVRQRIDTFRADLAQIDANAQRSVDPAAAKAAGLEFLKTLGKPVDPRAIDVLDNYVQTLPSKELGSLGPKSSASDILRAIHRIAEELRTREIEYPEGVEPLLGGDEIQPTQNYVIQRLIASLPRDARANLLAALESKEGQRAGAYIETNGGSGAAINDYNFISFASACLQKEFGKPVKCPGEGQTVDSRTLSPLARCMFNVMDTISGHGAANLRAAIIGPNNFSRSLYPAVAMHSKIDAAAKSMVCITFGAEMKKMATGVGETCFDKDIVRGMSITLPDGKKVSSKPAVARDQFARLVTGDSKATYASLSPADKAKANAFMALLSQETEKATEKGVPTALTVAGSTAAYSYATDGSRDAPQPVRHFEISGSPAEGFSIHYSGDFPALFLLYEDAKGNVQQTQMGRRITCSYEMEMRISAESLDQVSRTDWSQYDPGPSDAILNESEHANRLGDCYDAIPENYRLGVEVAAGFSIDIN